MNTAGTVPDLAQDTLGVTTDGVWHATFRSMASPVRLLMGLDTERPERRLAEVRALFTEVERQCTRFDAGSDLMRANAAADVWQPVGVHCYAAIEAARRAHESTTGMFDPRVLTVLADLGYATAAPATGDDVAPATAPAPASASAAPPPTASSRPAWTPGLDPALRAVRVGPEPIDLGGIGKGLALRWATDLLLSAGTGVFLLDAGGDCVFRGSGPNGDGWRIGVEDPSGGAAPIVVLDVADGACATSSTKRLSWRVSGRRVHHLIDPRSGLPGGGELRAVTVVGDDPADTEVWSKVLFLHGDRIAEEAGRRGLAAVWVLADGSYRLSTAAERYVAWRRP